MSKKASTPKVDVVIMGQHYHATITRDGEVIGRGRGDLPAIAIERAQAQAVDVIMLELENLDEPERPTPPSLDAEAGNAEPDADPD